MSRLQSLALPAFLCSIFALSGCGGVPAEATGDPVPDDYQEQQMKAQQKAMEEAMKNAGQ